MDLYRGSIHKSASPCFYYRSIPAPPPRTYLFMSLQLRQHGLTCVLAELQCIAKGTACDLGYGIHRHVPDIGVHGVEVLLEALNVCVIDSNDDIIDGPFSSCAAFKTQMHMGIGSSISV